jgi:hypothetical protein
MVRVTEMVREMYIVYADGDGDVWRLWETEIADGDEKIKQ